jgi:hypothetical protein
MRMLAILVILVGTALPATSQHPDVQLSPEDFGYRMLPEARAQRRVSIDVADSQVEASTHSVPALSVVGANLYCSWTEHDTTSRHGLRRWRVKDDSLGTTMYHTLRYFESRVADLGWKEFPHAHTLTSVHTPLASDAAVLFQEEYVAEYEYYRGRSLPPGRTKGMKTRTTIVRPSDMGWKVIEELEGYSITESMTLVYRGGVLANDPGDYTIVAYFDRGDFRPGYYQTIYEKYVIGYPRAGARWSLTSYRLPFETGVTVPIRGQRLLNIQGNRAVLYDTAVAVDTFALATDLTGCRYFSLHGSYFARTGYDGADLYLDVFDEQGIRRYSTAVRRPGGSTEHSVVQSPIDSTIAILYGGDNGVRVTIVRFDGTIWAHNVSLSLTTDFVGTPAGAFIGDTLVAAWTDSRLGVERVFGNYLTPVGIRRPTPASIAPPRPLYLASITIVPNPATDHATLFTDVDLTSARIDIVDLRGIVVHSSTQATDGGRIELDLAGLAPGVYVVHVRDESRRHVARIVVR